MKKILLLIFPLFVFTYFELSGQILTRWDFNSNPGDANTATGTLTPSTGSGTLSAIGGVTTSFASGGGTSASSDPNTTDNSAFALASFPASNANNKTAGIEFAVSTVGKSGITITFDQRSTNTAANLATLQYSTNGTTFTDATTFTTPSASGSIFINGRTYDLSSITALNNNANAKFRIVSTFNTASYAAVSGTYATSGTWRFDYVAVSYNAVLQVSLQKLSVKSHLESNIINWTTINENKSNFFQVQRANNPQANWQTIGTVKAAGNSQTTKDYQFADDAPLSISYYRLRSVDFDGKESLSNIVSVLSDKGGKLKVYPTIAQEKVTISSDSNEPQTFNIYNLLGQNVQTGQLSGQKDLNINTLSTGTYLLKVNGETVRFVKN